MVWKDKHEARRVQKFIKSGLYEPEDLKPNELRLIGKYYPDVYDYVKTFLEVRHKKVKNNEWTEKHEPPDRNRRIKRYERGEGIVEPIDHEEM